MLGNFSNNHIKSIFGFDIDRVQFQLLPIFKAIFIGLYTNHILVYKLHIVSDKT